MLLLLPWSLYLALLHAALAANPSASLTGSLLLAPSHWTGAQVTVAINKADLVEPQELRRVLDQVRPAWLQLLHSCTATLQELPSLVALLLATCLTATCLLNSAPLPTTTLQVAGWGYRAVGVSVVSGEGLDELTEVLAGRVTVVAGPSGAGKSSIINALQLRSLGLEGGLLDAMAARPSGAVDSEEEEEEEEEGACSGDEEEASDAEEGAEEQQLRRRQDGAQPAAAAQEQQHHPSSSDSGDGSGGSTGGSLQLPADLELQAVGNVSQRIGRGKHTTRNVTLIELEGRGGSGSGSGSGNGSPGGSSSGSRSSGRGGGGLVVDTPGFNQPDLSFPSGELGMHFPEIRTLVDTERCAAAAAQACCA